MRIRLATAEEADSISKLIVPLARKYFTHEFSDEAASAFLESVSPNAIKGYMDAGYRYHVAEEGDELAGVAAVRDHSHLYHLFVSDEWKDHCIGRELWYAAQEASREENPEGTFTVNSSRFAVGFYERLGFKRVGEETERDGVISVPMEFQSMQQPDGQGPSQQYSMEGDWLGERAQSIAESGE